MDELGDKGGMGKSFIITGALRWGLTLMGPEDTSKTMSWIGTALYAAYAVGAPAGTALYAGHGFAAVALATVLISLRTLALIAPMCPVAPQPQARSALKEVVGAVCMSGLALAISGVGFGAVPAFVALLFAARGRQPI